MVDNRKIFYSCDVLSNEQDMSKLHSSPLWGMYKYYSNLIVTPHVAGATVESQEKALRSILNLCTK
jgi:phosphoglycerate dehydrogenase-like enzyme